MAELAYTPPVLSLAGVANSQGYCSLNLAEVVPGCGTIDIELNGGSFRADVLPDRIIITATEPFDEHIFRGDGSPTDTTESTSSATGVPSLVSRYAPASLGSANGPGLLWALDLQQASASTFRSTVTSTRTSTRTSTSTSISTLRSTSRSTIRSTSISTLRSTLSTSRSISTSTLRPTSTQSTVTLRSTSTSTVKPASTIRSTSTRTSTSTSTSTSTRRFPFFTIAKNAASSTAEPVAIATPYFPDAPRFPPGRTAHLSSSASSVAASTSASVLSPARIPTQGDTARLPLHGLLHNIIGRSYRVQPQNSDETTTDSVEHSSPKGGSNSNPRPTGEYPAVDVDSATAITKVDLTSTCGRVGVSKLLDIDLDLSGINIDIDLYLDILSDSSSGSGGLVSGLLSGILGRRDLREEIKAKAAEQKEKAQKLKDRLKAEAAEEKEGVIRKTYEAKCDAVLAVPTTTASASSSTPTTTEAPRRRPAKANTRPSRPESAREITETIVSIEEVSEEVTVVEECIRQCEKTSIRASVRAGEVRECLGVTVKRDIKADNCVYFVGGIEVVDLELVLLLEEEADLDEEDEIRAEEGDARSDSFVPVRRGRRE
ncbi:hypothetical protein QBC40DRAFT_348950 [Triangularia verruculosa]|uniref:Uncharacterized protein n=1 Tax=Triangularia verruculosa TaxID=2587418 RepID=A0AAN6XGA6_9PEZI|nr:hypothetical protein QBC40DRAFT_348950 [Triangularia verruculosa]